MLPSCMPLLHYLSYRVWFSHCVFRVPIQTWHLILVLWLFHFVKYLPAYQNFRETQTDGSCHVMHLDLLVTFFIFLKCEIMVLGPPTSCTLFLVDLPASPREDLCYKNAPFSHKPIHLRVGCVRGKYRNSCLTAHLLK